jgi:hypothetical protein
VSLLEKSTNIKFYFEEVLALLLILREPLPLEFLATAKPTVWCGKKRLSEKLWGTLLTRNVSTAGGLDGPVLRIFFSETNKS